MSRPRRPVGTFGQVSRSVAAATGGRQGQFRSSLKSEAPLSIEVLPEYARARDFVKQRVPLVLVTGGAGTGKSTFVRWIDNQFDGSCLLSAPTGIAALTIGGKTLHALCQFPPAWIVDDDIRLSPKSPVARARVLVIDEISMVNANLLDGVDAFLKRNRRQDAPFGGMSVVIVGDLFQLPPVVTPTTRPLFEAEYSSPKFFAARAVGDSPFEAIELTKAFRQTDQYFVDLLAKVREGQDVAQALADLNSRANITDDPPAGSVWLCPRHVDVDRVNRSRLERLPGQSQVFECSVTGHFKESHYPVPARIELKVGAQVVLARNAKEWVNGSIATVTEVGRDRIQARLASTGKDVEVPLETWEQFDYTIDPASNAIERVVIGTFRQLPVILAWAMTIHRSQGLTLESVHLDLGAGAFETGQTYVALSRCRSLERLSLARALEHSDVRVDPEARAFYSSIRDK